MRRLLHFFLFLVLLGVNLMPLQQARAENDAAIPDVRVALSVPQDDSVTVAVEGSYECLGKTFTGGTLTATVTRDSVVLRHSELGELSRGDSVTVVRTETSRWAAFLTLENTRYGRCKYLGDMIFAHDSYGRIVLINRIEMREYLCGVVGGELNDAAPIEMLKAQTVAAKGFALSCINVSEPYDLTDTPTDQVYKGYKPVAENVTSAVDAVSGDTLLYEGAPVCCYYCTCNGGQTLTPKMRWGADSGQSDVYEMRYDPYDLDGSAAAVLRVLPDADQTEPKLYDFLLSLAREQAPDVSRILRVAAFSGAFSADHPEGTAGEPAARAPQERADVTLLCADASGTEQTVSCTFMLYTLYERGLIPLLSPNVWFVRPEDDGSWSIVFSKAVGHRVGMSHAGMQSMAEQGFAYDEILYFYYPNAVLVHGNAATAAPASPSPVETPAETAADAGGVSAVSTDAPVGPVVTPTPKPGLWERLFG